MPNSESSRSNFDYIGEACFYEMKASFLSAASVLLSVGILAVAVSSTERHLHAKTASVPNLVGTWTVDAEGAVLIHGSTPSAKSHHANEFSTLKAEAVIQKQDGRRVSGIFKSPRYSERFVGVIGVDGKTFSYVDEDGSLEGQIVSPNAINVSYRHNNAKESVVASGTWIRK
jgi:hypothetical protein